TMLQRKKGDAECAIPSASQGSNGPLFQPAATRRPSTVPIAIRIDSHCRLSLHDQIGEQIKNLIIEGKLRAGCQIPSSRQLAEHLGVSRNTVLFAYNQLTSEGYIDTKKGSHTYVSEAHPQSASYRKGLPGSQPQSRGPIRRQPVLFRGEAQR